ncbi:hypothetical protein [Pseudoteredinibacter isoporae]|uniref:Uncharacterized protein n=1 Tax=Pseudoteredinibacter isoporae TaxID=570281 RepID=A0A7X0MWP9_9GAMM|nr:hypothetical protein [Pseudoteredinibacter isoporae]MBB6522420.1 hypothetical protein [Pseudoteredinibacter isoporae]NHO87951.1 hypothetical protein [Pseudoteredinibacter isoporae]NIB23718.1 hypothetical protein [Pseudoteredinibacter isoporae]
MEPELRALLDVLEKSNSTNLVKDYILPLAIVFMGGVIAHISTSYMRYLDAQKEKIDIANDWILGFQQAFNSLIAIKSNYHNKLTASPLQRAGSFPRTIGSAKKLDLQVSKLSFIAQHTSDFSEIDNNHKNPSYISALQSNYNLLIEILIQRNKLSEEISSSLSKKISPDVSNTTLDLDEIYTEVSPLIFLRYIQLTEQAIKMTDELAIAIHNFLCKFTDICRYAIDTKRVKHYRRIMDVYYDHLELLNKSPDVDYDALGLLLGISAQLAKEKFVTGYEDQPKPIRKTTDMLKNPSVNQSIRQHKEDIAIEKHHKYWWK